MKVSLRIFFQVYLILFLVNQSFLCAETAEVKKNVECEVCVKVVDDIKKAYQEAKNSKENNKMNKIELAENHLEKHCNKKGLHPKDAKTCYSLLPLKKNVARQVSYDKESLKICKVLTKGNPTFCELKYPIKVEKGTDYSKMRVKQLKQLLSERGVACVGCAEKSDYVKKAQESEHMEL